MEKYTPPFATNSVIVPKAPPDGTSGGVTVKMDIRGLSSVTVYDAFPAEDDKKLVAFFKKRMVLQPSTCSIL
jgi:hypothetical protein